MRNSYRFTRFLEIHKDEHSNFLCDLPLAVGPNLPENGAIFKVSA